MRKKIILIYLSITVFILLLGGYFFLYNIYGSEVRRSPQNLYADISSEMTIEVIPINALGKKAWFRKSSADFDIVDGIYLIEITEYNKEFGFIKIRSKGKVGLVGIKIKSQHSLLPEYIEIEILALTV
ncbi:MAG: hypothetical protein KBE38_01445 [Ignavibacterium sp.]|nr:hypothetical protein [Ignavibacterium sp.]HRN27583.1 hypothetical protein [Ignavibacteriaceae bacterium]